MSQQSRDGKQGPGTADGMEPCPDSQAARRGPAEPSATPQESGRPAIFSEAESKKAYVRGQPAVEASRESLGELVDRANRGDGEALKELRRLLDERPDIWHKAGELGRYAEATWIDIIASGNALIRESIARTVEEQKKNLLGARPTAIEKLLVEQITACWLEVQYHQTRGDSAASGSLDLQALRLKRLESSQKRYLSSVKSLVQMRALLPEGLVPLNRYTVHRAAPA